MSNQTSSRLVPALFDGERLRQARLYHGWRKVDVARTIGITPAAVGQYESGRTRPSPSVLAELTLHLGFPAPFFERGQEIPHVPDAQAHFRKLRSTTKLERDRMLVRLELLSELVADIEAHVELPDVDIPVHPVTGEIDDDEPEIAATGVRRAWGLGPGPLDHVVRLLEAKGVIVVRSSVDSEVVDAFSTWTGARPIVVLGADKRDTARARFDAAHELGHFVMHHDAEPGRHVVERQAHRFAAAFLMPAEVIARELPTRTSWPTLFRLKQRWRVSLQALLYRARTLGVISPDAYQRAQIYLSRQGWRDNEPVELGPPEQPTLLNRALRLMRDELGVDQSALPSAARLPQAVLASLLQDAGACEAGRPRVVVG